MPTITGSLVDVGKTAVGSPLSAYVRAPSVRTTATGAITTKPVQVSTTGQVSLTLDVGPAVLVIDGGSWQDAIDLFITESMTTLKQAIEAVPGHLPPQVVTDIAALQVQLQERVDAAVAAATAQLQSSIAGSSGLPGQVLELSPSGAFQWSWAGRYHDTYSNQY